MAKPPNGLCKLCWRRIPDKLEAISCDWKLTTVYLSYARAFYARRPGLAAESYAAQQAALMQDAAGGADFWTHALGTLGYVAADITINLEPLQRARGTGTICRPPNNLMQPQLP